jgi:hypothetical protein
MSEEAEAPLNYLEENYGRLGPVVREILETIQTHGLGGAEAMAALLVTIACGMDGLPGLPGMPSELEGMLNAQRIVLDEIATGLIDDEALPN